MANYRKISNIYYAEEFQMGVMKVRQPLPAKGFPQLSPFLLLHHAGPMEIKPGSSDNRISPHPHRGFEPVTFVYRGEIFHRDSIGNEGWVGAGGVQWMTAGKGVVHSEGPSPELIEKGGVLEIIQLWINLPKKDKMTEPSYQDIPHENIPVIREKDEVNLALVAGEYKGQTGPAKTKTPVLIINGEIGRGGDDCEIDLPENYNAAIYFLDGEAQVNDSEKIEGLHLAVFEKAGEKIKIKATARTRFLLLAGEPINEPMVQYGPFVMNTNRELQQAILDYQNGEMGSLDF